MAALGMGIMRRLVWVAAVFALIAGCSAPTPAAPPTSASSSGANSVNSATSTVVAPSATNNPSLSTVAQTASVAQVEPAAQANAASPSPADPDTPADAASTDTNVAVMLVRPFGGESYGVIRPESLRSTSGGETVIDEIIWSSWTATEAHATATREFLDCTPSCAAGTVHPEPMTIDLSNPVGGVFRTLVTHVLDETQTTNDLLGVPGWLGYTDAGPDSSHVPLPAGYESENGGDKPPAAAPAGPADGSVTVLDSFVSPSSNILCAFLDGGLHCHINKYDFPLGPCDIERAPHITLGSTGEASMSPCIGDTFSLEQHPQPSSYGNRYQLKDIICDVEEIGVTCTNPEGHGFTLNRAAFSPF